MNRYNQLKATLAITKASLISMSRNPSSLIFSIIFPLVFILIFGVLGGGSTYLKVYLTNDSTKENVIYKTLESIKSIKFEKYDNQEEAYHDLSIGKIDGILKINFSDRLVNIDLETSQASMQNGALLQSVIKGVVNEINLSLTNEKIAQLNINELQGREYKQIDFFLPGQLGFALLNSGIFGSVFVLLSLKETLVLKRFFTTPIKKVNILLGEGLARLVFATIQAVIIILIGHFVFGFTLINGVSTLFEMILLSIFGLIVFLGMGLMISSISKDQNSIAPISNLFTLPQFLLGGVFFPIDIFPNWLQPITKILPLTHLNEAMRQIAFEGAGLTDIYKHLLVLLLWAFLVYFVTARTFKWDK